jgi:hypothetical protein
MEHHAEEHSGSNDPAFHDHASFECIVTRYWRNEDGNTCSRIGYTATLGAADAKSPSFWSREERWRSSGNARGVPPVRRR